MTATFGFQTPWQRSPWRLLLWAIPTTLLLTPGVAMQYTHEVRWSAFDFGFAALLLYGTTALIDLVMRKSGSWAFRLGVGVAVLTSFLLIWINGAVGFIGDEDNPANLLFIGVILLAVAGGALARFAPRGMARAMVAAALTTEAIAVLVLVSGWGAEDPPGTVGLVTLITAFAGLWLLSAGLFARAASHQAHG